MLLQSPGASPFVPLLQHGLVVIQRQHAGAQLLGVQAGPQPQPKLHIVTSRCRDLLGIGTWSHLQASASCSEQKARARVDWSVTRGSPCPSEAWA